MSLLLSQMTLINMITTIYALKTMHANITKTKPKFYFKYKEDLHILNNTCTHVFNLISFFLKDESDNLDKKKTSSKRSLQTTKSTL